MDYIGLAQKAALGAGELLRENFGKVLDIEYKAKNSLVTEIDRISEELIIEIIRDKFPSHSIFAEESGRDGRDSGHLWIIDPLDGTTNYTHTYPFFSVSIALEIDGEIKLGVVYDPLKNEMFSGEKGDGASLNNRPMKVSVTSSVEESCLCTGFIHTKDWMVEENLKHFGNFIRRSRALRRDGSAALDLCYVACGRFDGFWELGLNPWDTAAGFLICEEANGLVTDFSGKRFDVHNQELVATNGKIHDEMIRVLKLARGKRN